MGGTCWGGEPDVRAGLSKVLPGCLSAQKLPTRATQGYESANSLLLLQPQAAILSGNASCAHYLSSS